MFITSSQLVLSLSPPPLPVFPFNPDKRLERKHCPSHDEESFHHPHGINQRRDDTDTRRAQQAAAQVVERSRAGRTLGKAVDQQGRVDIKERHCRERDQELKNKRRSEVRTKVPVQVVELEAGSVQRERDDEHDAEKRHVAQTGAHEGKVALVGDFLIGRDVVLLSVPLLGASEALVEEPAGAEGAADAAEAVGEET